MYVVGGENSNAAKNPAPAEFCELDESQPFRECKIIKESKLDKQIRPKFWFWSKLYLVARTRLKAHWKNNHIFSYAR